MSDSRVLIAMDGSENSAMAFKCKYRLHVICNTKSKQSHSGNSPAKYSWLDVINYMNVFCTFLLRLFQTFCIFNFHTHMHWSLNHVRNVFFLNKNNCTMNWPRYFKQIFFRIVLFTNVIYANSYLNEKTFVFNIISKYEVVYEWKKKDKSSFSRDTVLYK